MMDYSYQRPKPEADLAAVRGGDSLGSVNLFFKFSLNNQAKFGKVYTEVWNGEDFLRSGGICDFGGEPVDGRTVLRGPDFSTAVGTGQAGGPARALQP